MLRRFIRKRASRSFASFLLLAFVARSLIPAGFMPAAERPFTLEICPDGMLARVGLVPAAGLPAHVHHHEQSGGAAHYTGHDQSRAAAQHAAHLHVAPADENPVPHDPHSTHKSWTHCPFAGLASAPIPLHAAAPTQNPEPVALAILDTDARFVSTTRFRIAQPRAPPVLSI